MAWFMAGEQVRMEQGASHEPHERSRPVGRTVPGEPALDLHFGDAFAGSAGTPRPTRFMAGEHLRMEQGSTDELGSPSSRKLELKLGTSRPPEGRHREIRAILP